MRPQLKTDFEAIEQEKNAFLQVLRDKLQGETVQEYGGFSDGHPVVLIVESLFTRKEFVEDIGVTIIYREAPFSEATFRGRTMCGLIHQTPLGGETPHSSLECALRTCRTHEIPVHRS